MKPHISEPGHFCGFYLSHEGNGNSKEIDERINESCFHGGEKASNCTILTMSPPIYVIGEKKPEKKSCNCLHVHVLLLIICANPRKNI